jgi:hypothetical protein
MKTHVIHLAAHDDYHSTRDQMTWAKSARILLVLPRKGQILRTRLDLVLLDRQAIALGAQLALVTDDEVVLGNAGELKIPVFETIKEAQKKTWKVTGKKKPMNFFHKSRRPELVKEYPNQSRFRVDLGNTWTRLIVFSLGVFAVIALLLVLLPEAEIEITPATRLQEMQFTIKADPRVEQGNISGLVPMRTISIEVTETETKNSSGTINVGDNPATGELEVRNLTDSEITVPAGTIFRTLMEPIQRYQSTKPIKLAPQIGSTAKVPIQAINPGEAGNVEKEMVTGVEGQIGLWIEVTNPQNLENGSDRQIAAPTEQDLRDLEKVLALELEKSAIKAMQAAEEGSIILPESIKIEEVLTQIQDPEIGTPADTMTLKSTAQYSGSFIDVKDIQNTANLIMDANLPKGYKPSENPVEVEVLSTNELEGSFLIKASRNISARVSPDQISQFAAGKTPEAFLSSLPRIIEVGETPIIQIRPFFLGRFPFLSMRIHIEESL